MLAHGQDVERASACAKHHGKRPERPRAPAGNGQPLKAHLGASTVRTDNSFVWHPFFGLPMGRNRLREATNDQDDAYVESNAELVAEHH
jgi:hypothetical protein